MFSENQSLEDQLADTKAEMEKVINEKESETNDLIQDLNIIRAMLERSERAASTAEKEIGVLKLQVSLALTLIPTRQILATYLFYIHIFL